MSTEVPAAVTAAATVVVAATAATFVEARATARTAVARSSCPVLVIDVDGTHEAVGSEQVVALADLAEGLGLVEEAARAAVTLDVADRVHHAALLGATSVIRGGGTAVVLSAGVVVLHDLRPVVPGLGAGVMLVVPATDVLGLAPPAAAAGLESTSGLVVPQPPPVRALDRAMVVVGDLDAVEALRTLGADWRCAPTALDRVAAAVGATVVVDPAVLVGPDRPAGGLAAGRAVLVLDLSRFDPHRPGVLDASTEHAPRVSLRDHPTLAAAVLDEARARLADEARARGLHGRPDVDLLTRAEARRAGADLPDVLGLGAGPDLRTWAVELLPASDPRPVARYLAAFRHARPQLHRRFPEVPGADTEGLARWALKRAGSGRGWDPDLLTAAAQSTLDAPSRLVAQPAVPPGTTPGVNLVGYLAGELGLGVSARLVDDALRSVGVETSTFDVSGNLVTRAGAHFRRSSAVVREVSVLCVNAAELPALAPRLGNLVHDSRVIGMWYWELEEFPAAPEAFALVDEVWVATDFMREAIAAQAGDVPVRTVTPPLPQAVGPAGPVPERLGLPLGRPYLLFTFDFQSMAARKNPTGLVEAFDRAFADRAPDERPLLVVKTINAARHPRDADQLRDRVAGRSDVVFLDAFLDDVERHVLVAGCAAYVSLHRAEGLGLTVAEAMAWGRPVVTTAYGGVLQFCTEDNAFLVDWRPGRVPETTGPYQQGMAWADPDLDHAARLLRAVVDEPARAASVGARAAEDIRSLHNATVAGERMVAALAEGAGRGGRPAPTSTGGLLGRLGARARRPGSV